MVLEDQDLKDVKDLIDQVQVEMIFLLMSQEKEVMEKQIVNIKKVISMLITTIMEIKDQNLF